MKLSKYDLTGTGKVFRFTLAQHLKNKANIVTLVVLAVFSLASVPVMTLVMGGGAKEQAASEIKTVYIQNDTDYALSFGGTEEYGFFAGTEFRASDFPAEDYWQHLNGYEAFVYIYRDSLGSYCIDTYTREQTALSDYDLSVLGELLSERFDQARYLSLDATSEQLEIITSGWTMNVQTVEDYLSAGDLGWETRFAVQYIYAIIAMMVSVFSVAYIVRSVVEEKASKLVELLMISVRPLALILGKILAVMTYVFGMFALLIASLSASYFVSGMFMDVSAVGESLASSGISAQLLRLSPMTVIVIVVSLALGYMTFSIISGLSAARCSTMDDVESANLAVILIIMGGYLVSCVVAAFDSTAVAVISSLFPIVSIFCAPVQYVVGQIGFGMLCLSWLIQAAVLAVLALFCAKVYRDLIMYSGSRVKFRQMLSMAKTSAAKEAG